MKNDGDAVRLFLPSTAGIELVSFDVFDTLIARTVRIPTDVFRIVRAKLLQASCALLDPAAIDGFPELRVEAERVARACKQRDSGSDEVTLEDIYRALAQLVPVKPETLALLRDVELETEKQVAYANPEAAVLLAAARASGKRIVLCSDMYLSAREIRDLLRSCGYADDDPIFVSCEHERSKHHGTLFAHLARETGVALERILHVGDNPHGDILMARTAGCLAQHVPQPVIPPPAASPWTEDDQNAGTVSSITAGLLLKRRRRPGPADADPFHDLGYRVFGPLFTGFLLWLRRAVSRKCPDRILLLARDMHWAKTMLPRFLALDGPVPDMRYVHVSRAAVFLPGMTDFLVERLVQLSPGRAALPVDARLRRLGLDPAVLVPVIRSAGFASVDEAVASGDPRLLVLFGKLYDRLLRVGAERRPIVQEYLDEFIAGASDVLLVDVGWAGTIQASLCRLLGSRYPALRLRGYYIGTFGATPDRLIPAHSMHGWLSRPDRPASQELAMWQSGGVELLEFAMRAPHGTVLGYRREMNGTIAPELEANEAEEALAPLAARLQEGACAFIGDFLAGFATLHADGLDSRAWAGPFFRLVTAPTAAEAELLGNVTHSDAAGTSLARLPLAPKIADPVARAKAGLEACYWTPGFLARNDLMDDETFDEALYFALYPDVRAVYPDGSGHQHWCDFGRNEARMPSWAAWRRRQLHLG